jgi:glycosyltransferase involved in cell wall biosynthesis
MRLTVLSMAYPFAPVGPGSVGGAERILADLDRALIQRGHKSMVVACEGSQPEGELFPVPMPAGDLDESARRTHTARFQAAIDRAVSARRPDLIHMHGLDFHEYDLPPRIPVIVTLHLPVAWYPAHIWARCCGRVLFQCVSETQRRSGPPELSSAPVIQNGVFPPPSAAEDDGDFALILGRICPEKNQHEALEAATAARIQVRIGGEVFPYPEHRAYFKYRIEPLLEPGGHRYLGPLSSETKWRLLANARCLLHPTLAPETSSLVAMEALAAGTPVIAYPSGALPEIVRHGLDGFLVANMDEMARAIRNTHLIDRAECRQSAAQRFSGERMIRQYFDLYASCLTGHPAGCTLDPRLHSTAR